ncbi:MAG: FkbM family methyltransferase [Patescibacteria group bacterium]|nr:FkbM family methyltransferase [Patescibacteria group bacterium]
MSIYGFVKGYFNIGEFFLLFLPTRFKSEEIRVKFSDYLNREAKSAIKEFINEDGSINLYGHEFYPPKENFYELAGLLFELVVFDQYKAREHLKDGSVVIDAGANIGSFSIFAVNIKKDLVVYAFEPVKETFEILKKNTSPYPNVFCYNYGLGDENVKKKIFVYRGATGGSTFEDSGMISARCNRANELLEEEAQIVTMDDFVEENKVSKVDFIKMDTEGYELQILKGARKMIGKFKPVISVSAYHHEDDKEEIPKLVKSIDGAYQYNLFREYEEDLVFYAK